MNIDSHFYVSSSGKKFALGSVKDVKIFLKNAGLNIVSNSKQADIVIVPDGAKTKYNVPTYTWNNVILFLKSNKLLKKPKPIKKTQKKPLQILQPLETLESFDFNQLQNQLNNLQVSQVYVNDQKTKQIKIPIHTINIDLGINYMKQLSNPKILEYLNNEINPNYILDLYPGIHLFYLQLEHLFQFIFQFWAEVRGNLELFMTVPPIIETDKICNDLSSWKDYQHHFHPLQVKEMCNLSNFPKPKELLQVLNKLEQDLINMQFSMVCKHKQLNDMFDLYVKETKRKFRTCESLSKLDCTHECMFFNEKCQDKPFLITLDSIIKSFCHSQDSNSDDIDFLELNLEEIFVNLYNLKPEEKENKCSKIIYMFEMIKKSLELMIGKSIRWSQVSDFLDISPQVWKDLWLGTLDEKKSSLDILSNLKEDPFFIQQTKQLIIALANVGL